VLFFLNGRKCASFYKLSIIFTFSDSLLARISLDKENALNDMFMPTCATNMIEKSKKLN